MIEFDKSIDMAIQQQLDGPGIVLHSCSWVKGPTFSFSENSSP